MVKFLLLDQRVDPAAKCSCSFSEACQRGHVDVVKLLLSDARVDPTALGSTCFSAACSAPKHSVEVVKLLVDDGRVDCFTRNHLGLQCACESGDISLVEYLMLHLKLDPVISNSLFVACRQGHSHVVKFLLNDPRINLSLGESHCLSAAAAGLHNEGVIDLLLSDPRIDLLGDDLGRACRTAVRSNNVEIVRRLLRDPRVDPNLDNGYLFSRACRKGLVEMVEMLLADPRVIVDQLPESPISIAASKFDERLLSILIKDSRFKDDIRCNGSKYYEIALQTQARPSFYSRNFEKTRFLGMLKSAIDSAQNSGLDIP